MTTPATVAEAARLGLTAAVSLSASGWGRIVRLGLCAALALGVSSQVRVRRAGAP
ncbi:hypothetical protein [Xanthobacter sediminis]|uniref:hypothetical protein n=1 Tax=Xanthobacter sediminis TaxID=3119926 RepID=UPI0037291C73